MAPRTRKKAVVKTTMDALMAKGENIGNGERASMPAIQV